MCETSVRVAAMKRRRETKLAVRTAAFMVPPPDIFATSVLQREKRSAPNTDERAGAPR